MKKLRFKSFKKKAIWADHLQQLLDEWASAELEAPNGSPSPEEVNKAKERLGQLLEQEIDKMSYQISEGQFSDVASPSGVL
jgi:hypothetical protein